MESATSSDPCIFCTDAQGDGGVSCGEHYICYSCLEAWVSSLAQDAPKLRSHATPDSVACPACPAAEGSNERTKWCGRPIALAHIISSWVPAASSLADAVSLVWQTRLEECREALNLRCPGCRTVLDPSPDACTAMCCSRCAAHFCFACLERQPSAEAAHRHVPAAHHCESVFAPLATVQAAQNRHRLQALGELLRLDAAPSSANTKLSEWRDLIPGGASADALVESLATELEDLGLPTSLGAFANQWRQQNTIAVTPAVPAAPKVIPAAVAGPQARPQHQLRLELPPGIRFGPHGELPPDVLPGLRASIQAQLAAQQPHLVEQLGPAALEEHANRHLTNVLGLIRRQVAQQRQPQPQQQQQQPGHPGLQPGRRWAGSGSTTLLPLPSNTAGDGAGGTTNAEETIQRANSLRVNCERGNWEAVVQLLHAFKSLKDDDTSNTSRGDSAEGEHNFSGIVDWSEGDALGRTLLQQVIMSAGDGRTPRDPEACDETADRVAQLLAHGCDATARAEHGHTPLHLAAVSKNLKVVELLADNLVAKAKAQGKSDGALRTLIDPSLPDGRTPMHLACSLGQVSVVSALLTRGADPSFQANPGSATCLQYAITTADPDAALEIVRVILCGNVGPEARDRESGVRRKLLELPGEHGCTPLHHAIWRRHRGLVEFLVDHCKCNLEATIPANGRTPLAYACELNAVDIALLLVDRGADIASFHDLPETWKRQPVADRLAKLQKEKQSTACRSNGEQKNHADVDAPLTAAVNPSNTDAVRDASAMPMKSDEPCNPISAAAAVEMPESDLSLQAALSAEDLSESTRATDNGELARRDGAAASGGTLGCLFDEAAAESLVGLRVCVCFASETPARTDVFGTVVGWGVHDPSERGSDGSNAKRSNSNTKVPHETNLRCNEQRALVHHVQLDRANRDNECQNAVVNLTYAELLIAHGRALMANSPHAFQTTPPLLLPRYPASAPTISSTSSADASSKQEPHEGQDEFYDAQDDGT